MKTLSRIFNKRCADEFGATGFLKVKGSFVRLSNDVLHVFLLKHFRNVPSCTVEFSIIPLCGGVPIFLEAGKYILSDFYPERLHDWRYDPNSNESIELCVESLVHAINEKLIPQFTNCADSASALLSLIKLDELFDNNRKKSLELMGSIDRASPWQERSMFDSRKFYLALKSCNYVYAELYLRFHVSYHQFELERMEKPESTKQPESVIREIKEDLDLCLELLKRLTSGDYVFFDNLLLQNEAQAKLWLFDRYPAITKLFKS